METGSPSTTSEAHPSTIEANPVMETLAIDNSSVQIAAEKLNGKNFREWAQTVKLAIGGKSKMEYLTGEVKQPETTDTKAFQRWQSENSMVMSWLINSMQPTISRTFMFLRTAKDIWTAVREAYSDEENVSQIFEIKTRLWQMKQGERDVTDYYIDMVALWQELDLSGDEEWHCTEDSALFKRRLEKERVFEFLAGLNRDLDNVRGRILGQRPLPSTREVFSEVRREAARRKVMLKDDTNAISGPAITGSALLSHGYNESKQQ